MPTSTDATLNFNYIFTADAGTTYSYQLLGDAVDNTITVDHVVNIQLPPSQLSKVLCYGSNWYLQTGSTGVGETGAAGTTYYQPEPSVALLLGSVLGSVLDDLTAGLTGVTSGVTYSSDASNYITDDDAAQVPNLVRKFQDIRGFTYLSNGADDGTTGTVVDYLSQIPVEAIQSVHFSPVDTLPLSEVTGDLTAFHSAGATMGHTGLSGAVQSLFEQAVAAGMVTAGNTAGPDLTLVASWTGVANDVPQAVLDLESEIDGDSSQDMKVYGATFSEGQSLGIFVKYNLKKVRQYQLATNPSTIQSSGGNLWNVVGSDDTLASGQLKVSGSELSVHITSNSDINSGYFLEPLKLAVGKAGPSGLEVTVGSKSITFVSATTDGTIYTFTASSPITALVDTVVVITYDSSGPLGAPGVATLTFGGETFDTVLGNAAEVSEPVPVIYQIVFTATSPV
jgi:hypothetical protein